jgi:hypothetical protein
VLCELTSSRRPYSSTYAWSRPAPARTLLARVPVASLPLSFFYVLDGCHAIGQGGLITCIKHLLSQEEIINQTDNRICMKMAVIRRLDCGFFSFAHCIHSLCMETSHVLTIRVRNTTDDSSPDYRQTRRIITDNLHTGICKLVVLPRQSYDTRKLDRDSKEDTSEHKCTAPYSQEPLAINGTHR